MVPAEIFAEWLRRQGATVLQTPSTYWYESVPLVYQAFPFHWLIDPDKQEIASMFSKGALAIRYSTPMDSQVGAPSYHVVYEQTEYDMATLTSKARNHVKKGLSVATVEPISFDRLAKEGWELRWDTLVRQGRQRAENEHWWKKLCLAAAGLPRFEAWGAIAEGKLVAALLAFAYDDYFSILYQQSRTDYMRFGVNNALTHVITSDVLNRPQPLHLFYGLHSLDAPDSVDEFKFQMRYVAKPVRQMVAFTPWLRPLVNPASHMALRLGRRLLPKSTFLAKTEGMFRVHLESRLHPSRQALPGALN